MLGCFLVGTLQFGNVSGVLLVASLDGVLMSAMVRFEFFLEFWDFSVLYFSQLRVVGSSLSVFSLKSELVNLFFDSRNLIH